MTNMNLVVFLSALLVGANSFMSAADIPSLYYGVPKKFETKDYKFLKKDVMEELSDSLISKEKIDLLMDVIYFTEPKVCVEVGAFSGLSVFPVAVVLKHLGRGKMYAIDAWSNIEATKNLEDTDPLKDWWLHVDMKKAHQFFLSRLETWSLEDYCESVSLPSDKAIHALKKIDFLHLDGDFSEIGSIKDAKLYVPKVRHGGYILLSNLSMIIQGKQSKVSTYEYLLNFCDVVAEIENFNSILFKKK